MGKLGWCMTGHHRVCPTQTFGGLVCGCSCHENEGTAPDRPCLTLNGDQAASFLEMHHPAANISSHGSEISFGIDGIFYKIELPPEQASQLRDALAPFIRKARSLENVEN
ncbi:hypothetical protein ACIPJS_39615 [Streptomyces sp. NPDC086783]|uniref:Lsr2 dimerization domain-containing protein n=1 Tax=Streptomyces sp. NPDC086783 TaxID=3365758 RepID=UPI00382BF6F9